MRHSISLALFLAAIWLLNSGHYTPLITGLGAASIVLVVWISHKMDVVDHEAQPIHLTQRFPSYCLWIFVELIKSNVDVVTRIWKGPKAISPTIATLPISQTTDVGKVIYANSITLTPGTLTIDLTEDSVTVHALSAEGIESLKTGDMDQRVKRLEG